MPSKPSKALESFPNPRPGRDYEIAFEVPEFTCLCPRTGQPDFATLRIRYVPDAIVPESPAGATGASSSLEQPPVFWPARSGR